MQKLEYHVFWRENHDECSSIGRLPLLWLLRVYCCSHTCTVLLSKADFQGKSGCLHYNCSSIHIETFIEYLYHFHSDSVSTRPTTNNGGPEKRCLYGNTPRSSSCQPFQGPLHSNTKNEAKIIQHYSFNTQKSSTMLQPRIYQSSLVALTTWFYHHTSCFYVKMAQIDRDCMACGCNKNYIRNMSKSIVFNFRLCLRHAISPQPEQFVVHGGRIDPIEANKKMFSVCQ